jgi:hypothetical protein
MTRGKTVKKKAPLRTTPNMVFVLAGICDGLDVTHGCNGRSEYGARGQTLISLHVRGLLDENHKPTEAGLALIAKSRARMIATHA